MTYIGKFVGSVFALLGIGLLALPTGILGAGYVEELSSGDEEPTKCPRCDKEV